MSDPAPSPIALHVVYSGRVQGVGFRATALGLARRHRAVSGWVRNLPDGDVELWAEGPEPEVLAFLQALRERWPPGYIERIQSERQAATGQLAGFEIRR